MNPPSSDPNSSFSAEANAHPAPDPVAPQPPPQARREKIFGFARRWRWVAIALLAFGVGLWVGLPSGGSEHEHDAPPAAETAAGSTIWTCSMHPQIRMNEPGKCPICGMDLIPAGDGSDDQLAPNQVALSERAKIMARIQTVAVRSADASADLQMLGRLEHDETRVRTVTPWTGGRIDRLFVNTTGERIGAGQTIATLYSPEVYAAHQDLIQAKRQVEQMGEAIPVARKAAEAALESSRNRLRLLGVGKAQLAKMEQAESPSRHVSISSPYGGTILEVKVAEGQYVDSGTALYRLTDLSNLWVQLDAYESDLAKVKVGQQVALRVESYPGERFEGKVTFIDPVLNTKTRTAKVRVEVKNKEGRLRPGVFVQAVLHKDGEQQQPKRPSTLVIPDTAPLFTGTRSVVYVEVPGTEKATYEAREVRLGPRAGDVYPVLSGLQAGERVVARGAFALDSDLQIRGGKSMMTTDDDRTRMQMEPVEVDAEFRKKLSPVVDSYLEARKALASDDLEAARAAFSKVAKSAQDFEPTSTSKPAKLWKEIREQLRSEAMLGAKAEDIETARRSFQATSQQVIVLLHRFGNPLQETLRLAFCPMADGNQGAYWVQRPEVIENPYFGASMLNCGEVRGTVEHGVTLSAKEHKTVKKTSSPAAGHQH